MCTFDVMFSKTIKNITSISLAFLVLFSTMSFSINEHYCGGSLVDTSWFVKADTCGMEMDSTENKNELVSSDSCCNDVITIIEGQDEVQQTVFNFSSEQQIFLTAFVYSYADLFIVKESTKISFENYISPLLVNDIHLLDETFLI
jgi:uncharacterized protein YfcZ (UPF0381/DUF406 family)